MHLTEVLGIRKVVPFGQVDPWFKRNQLMKFAFNYKGRAARCHKLGVNKVFKALQYVKATRQVRRYEMEKLWDERIAIASTQCGLPNGGVLREGLTQSNIILNSNMLQILAVYEPRTFSALADIAKQYHLDRGFSLPNAKLNANVVTRGMLTSPIVPGNKHLY